MIDIEIDTSVLEKKLTELQSDSLDSTLQLFVEDSGAFMLSRLRSEQLNFNPIGIRSGNLRRSQQLNVGQLESSVQPELTIAPYAPYVASYSSKKFGKPYIKITLGLYGGEVVKKFEKVISQFVKDINNGKKPKYKNPY